MSQFVTANRCRMIPLAAWTRPMPNSRPAYFSRASVSLAATPSSMARPITAGSTAWLLIQTMPKHIPPSSVCRWPLAIHHRKRTADRWSAVPG